MSEYIPVHTEELKYWYIKHLTKKGEAVLSICYNRHRNELVWIRDVDERVNSSYPYTGNKATFLLGCSSYEEHYDNARPATRREIAYFQRRLRNANRLERFCSVLSKLGADSDVIKCLFKVIGFILGVAGFLGAVFLGPTTTAYVLFGVFAVISIVLGIIRIVED